MAESAAPKPTELGRLQKKFDKLPSESHSKAWSELWDQGDSGLWDRGGPSPALLDLLQQRRDVFNPTAKDSRRKVALIPGCGRGYEVALLALYGYDAYGLEISSAAIAAGREYVSPELQNPSQVYFPVQDNGEVSSYPDKQGEARFFLADFFDKGWTGTDAPAQYDLVYDYTFFCALPPEMRKRWGRRMAELLRPGGLLVCLEFPTYKDPTLPGPPWGVGGGVYWDVLARGGTGMIEAPIPPEVQDAQADDPKGEFMRILLTKPARSYAVGKGTDMLSVWRRK